MPKNISNKPRSIPQVMVSSTFTDLVEHREALIRAIHKHKLHANVMEHDDARLHGDMIDSSLQMVRDSAAYLLIVSHKYGQTPVHAERNPGQVSITELEFDEAQRLGRPTLLFVMSDKHPVTKADIERDPEKEKKLEAFRERAKKASPGSQVNRVYAKFDSLEDFKDKIASSLAELSQHLQPSGEGDQSGPPPERKDRALPPPPAFYAEPDYIGSHKFVGREAEFQTLSDWAKPADPTNLLLFEAIGGNGKSMLTWQWAKNHATAARPAADPWVGRFWYSFYERGAIMADFCQHALAYMTERPLADFAKKKTGELKDDLLAQLHARPWLLILDGLERVLVAYHRIDAAELPDEAADQPTDQIASRNPCDAIRDEDNDLLRALAAAAPSKILVSSRLTPRILLNSAGQPIPGARRITLPGLRSPDAEKLLRSCGIEGDSAAIQDYLAKNCDNHPLVIGILGGLIANYLPARGNFDRWVADADGGAKLDLGQLDLIQRRNHILRTALADLPPARRQLLSTLALLSESVEYETLKAFNSHLPPEPEKVEKPERPEEDWDWDDDLPKKEKVERQKQYKAAITCWQEYEKSVQARLASAEFREAPMKLADTVRDLEQRGLLQYDGRTRRHDLHPVVRAVAAGSMQTADKERYGQRVIDHFNSLPHSPYEQAETLEDLRPGLNVVRTLLKLGRFQQAADAYGGDFEIALEYNVEASSESLALLKSFFSQGWEVLPAEVSHSTGAALANSAGNALESSGIREEALVSYGAALRGGLEAKNWEFVGAYLSNISETLSNQHSFARGFRINQLALELVAEINDRKGIFALRCRRFSLQALLGIWAEAQASWHLLDSMGREWPRGYYRPGDAELSRAMHDFWAGTLVDAALKTAEQIALEGKNRRAIRSLHGLRATWRLEQSQWALAASSFAEALRMARESGIPDAESETGLALAKHHLGQLADPAHEAVRLVQLRHPAHRYLSLLWLAIGDTEQAKKHALAAYKRAWADGEPYVHRYELTKTTELLRQMNVPIPDLPPYDPANDKPFPWEADVLAAIEKLRAGSEVRKARRIEY